MVSIRQGISEIFAPDLNGTLTTIIVFLPLLFITGYMKDMITPFGLTITLTLLGSFLISITLIPALVYWKGGMKGNKANGTASFLKKFESLNDRLMNYVLQHKRLVGISLVIMFLAGGAALPFFNKADMLPPVDEGALLFEYVMRPGVSLTESESIAKQLIQVIQKKPNVKNIYFFLLSINLIDYPIVLHPDSECFLCTLQFHCLRWKRGNH